MFDVPLKQKKGVIKLKSCSKQDQTFKHWKQTSPILTITPVKSTLQYCSAGQCVTDLIILLYKCNHAIYLLKLYQQDKSGIYMYK